MRISNKTIYLLCVYLICKHVKTINEFIANMVRIVRENFFVHMNISEGLKCFCFVEDEKGN